MKRLSFENFCRNTHGNFAAIFSVILLVMMTAAGGAIDYSSQLNAQTHVQNAADAAILAGVKLTQKNISNGMARDQAKRLGRKMARDVFAANMAGYKVKMKGRFAPSIRYDNGTIIGKADYDGSINASFLSVVGLKELSVDVVSTATTKASQFVDLHFVIDNSSSLGIGADASDVSIMAGTVNCAFACHGPPGAVMWGVSTDTVRNAGATLRIDVVRSVALDMVDQLAKANAGSSLRIAVHTFSNDLQTLQAPTADTNQVKTALNKLDLAEVWGQGGTSFDHSLRQASSKIGISGSGASASQSKKVVILITDGVATNLQYDQATPTEVSADPNFVNFSPTYNGNGAWQMQGFNPKACDRLKSYNKAELYTLEVEYVIPKLGADDDPRFDIVKNNLAGDITKNLRKCATGSTRNFKAKTSVEIENALDKILESVTASSLRLSS